MLKSLRPPDDTEETIEPSRAWRIVRLTSLIAAITALGVAALIVCLALFTGICNIRKVNITGNKFLSAEYLRQLSGVDSHKNLVTLPVGRIARNLESNPWVRRVRVRRRLLNTVDIEVTERVPVAVLDYSGTGFLVDSNGFVTARTPLDQFAELPRVHGGTTAAPPVIGEVLKDKKMLECVKVIGRMPAPVQAVLALGNPFDGRGQVFITRLGFQVVYGHETDARKKNEVLQVIIADVASNKRNIAYIDVRVPDSPVIRPL